MALKFFGLYSAIINILSRYCCLFFLGSIVLLRIKNEDQENKIPVALGYQLTISWALTEMFKHQFLFQNKGILLQDHCTVLHEWTNLAGTSNWLLAFDRRVQVFDGLVCDDSRVRCLSGWLCYKIQHCAPLILCCGLRSPLLDTRNTEIMIHVC